MILRQIDVYTPLCGTHITQAAREMVNKIFALPKWKLTYGVKLKFNGIEIVRKKSSLSYPVQKFVNGIVREFNRKCKNEIVWRGYNQA